MSDKSYTAFNALVDIIASPKKAIDEIQHHGKWFWLPFLIMIVVAIGQQAYYFNWVDFDWFIDQSLSAVPPEQLEATKQSAGAFMKPSVNLSIAAAAIVIISFLIYALQATWLNLSNKVSTGSGIGFGQWFSLSVWSWFPSVFNTIAGFVAMLMADSNQFAADRLAPFSINSLVLHASPGDPWFTWGQSVQLLMLWALILLGLGYSRWTGSSLAKGMVIAFLPWVLVFGIWAAIIAA